MGPARRRDHRYPPRRIREGLGHRLADFHAAPRMRRGRVSGDRRIARRHKQGRGAALGVQQVAAVAIDRERHDRVGEAFAVPIEIEEGVGKGVRQRMVQRLIGIGHVDAALDQPGGEVFGGLAVAVQFQCPVAGLAPAVCPAAIAVLPRLDREIVVIAEQAKGRDDVLAEILVLVVAPHQHDIRVERVERLAHRAKALCHSRAVALGRGKTLVIAEFGNQFGRPIGRVLVVLGHVGCGQQPMKQRRQLLVGDRQPRIVGAAKTKNLAHFPAPLSERRTTTGAPF